ncbi:MAG: hypothetical protein AB1489_38095, partial [Acidobacteriota bacterium]
MFRNIFLTFAILLLTNLSVLGQVDRPLIYVCYDRGFEQGDPNDALIMLDGMTLEEIGRVPLDNCVFDIALRNDKRVAFVSSSRSAFCDNRGLAIIDLTQQKRIHTMFAGTKLRGVEIGPKGIVYILAELGKVILIDPHTFQTIHTITLPNDPDSIVFSNDEKKAYVMVSGGIGSIPELLILDLTNNFNIIKSIPVLEAGGTNNGQILSPDGRRLYIAGNNVVAVVDTEKLELLDPLPGTPATRLLQLSRDGKTLYAADGGGSRPGLLAIDTQSGRIIKSFEMVDGANRFLALSPDGNLLYLSNTNAFFQIVDTRRNELIASHRYEESFEGFGRGIAVTGDFSIGIAPSIQVASPQPSEIVQRGKPFTIRWQTTSGGFIPGKHTLEISTDGGQSFGNIMSADNLRGTTQEFEWNVPNQIISSAQIRITAFDVGGRVGTKTSEIFSIGDRPPDPIDNQPPTVRFLNPLGGERFNQGDNLTITWSSS